MATFDIDVAVGFLDSAERIAEITYRLRQQYDDTDPPGSTWADVVAEADDLVTYLNVLTYDHIDYHRIMMVVDGPGLSAAIQANNQVRAFTRVTKPNSELGAFEVPAWDDTVFDQDSQNLLSAAYNANAQDVADLLEDPDDGQQLDTVNWSQSRTRKSRNVVS